MARNAQPAVVGGWLPPASHSVDSDGSSQRDDGARRAGLTHFREAFTSENWMVRVYEVLPEGNREA
jgi:hypothetical protein